jgi:Cd2+/Zn2+-exporting ATPase
LGGRDETQVLEALASLERSSEHPIGKAILREAESRGIHAVPANGFQTLSDLGVVSQRGPEWTLWAGSPARLDRRAAGAAEALRETARLSAGGLTVVAFGASRGLEVEVWGLVALSQPVQPGIAAQLAALGGLGVDRVVLLTGDLPESAEANARAAGIREYYAGLGPVDKTARIASLMGRGGGVAYLGDSIHDAEAMAAATVGIAMGPNAADFTRENAGVLILPQDLGRLGFLIAHARATLRVIQQNVWIAVGAKFLFLAAALTGSATLWMAIAADMGATLVVTLNGLRLLRPSRHPME